MRREVLVACRDYETTMSSGLRDDYVIASLRRARSAKNRNALASNAAMRPSTKKRRVE